MNLEICKKCNCKIFCYYNRETKNTCYICEKDNDPNKILKSIYNKKGINFRFIETFEINKNKTGFKNVYDTSKISKKALIYFEKLDPNKDCKFYTEQYVYTLSKNKKEEK